MTRASDAELLLRRTDVQHNKDYVLERLWARTDIDGETGCFIYTGYWDEAGIAHIWVNGRQRPICRVAAWIYRAGFDLDGDQVAMHYRCESPACWNPEHIRVVSGHGEKFKIGKKLWRRPEPRPARALSYDRAEFIRLQATTMSLPDLASEYGLRLRTIREVVNNLSWVRS